MRLIFHFLVPMLTCSICASTALANSCGTLSQGSFKLSCDVTTDTTSKFNFYIVSSGPFQFTQDIPFTFLYDGNWHADVSGVIRFTDNSVTASGTGWHINPPHQEASPGPKFPFALGGVRSNDPLIVATSSPPHGKHFDRWQAMHFFSISPSTKADTYYLSLTASHTPEPGIWAMMIVGFGSIGGALRRRRGEIGQVSTQ